MKLCVTCKQYGLTFSIDKQIIYVHKEECWTKHGSLRNATPDFGQIRLSSVDSNSLFSSR